MIYLNILLYIRAYRPEIHFLKVGGGGCVCVFVKLLITGQYGPVILVILCHSH